MGCPAPKEALDAGLGPADAAVAVVDAGAPVVPADLPPAELGVELEVWFADGGLVSAKPSVAQTIEPAQKLTLLLPMLTDFRVRVFDSADRVLVSDDDAQPNDGGIAYAIGLAEPLKRGREYRVLIDAQTGAGLTEDTGRRYLDAEWTLKVDGPAEPEAPAGKSGKKSGGKPGKGPHHK